MLKKYFQWVEDPERILWQKMDKNKLRRKLATRKKPCNYKIKNFKSDLKMCI